MPHIATAILVEGSRYTWQSGRCTVATYSKWDVFLLVVATLLILALKPLHLHAKNYPFSSYLETYKVNHSVTVLDLMALSAVRTYR